MALQTATISLPVATSIDQKSDNKQISADKLEVSNNVRVLKTNRVQKRFGRSALSNTQTQINPSYPVTISTDTNQSWSEVVNGQRVLYNNGFYYLRDTVLNQWTQSHYQPIWKTKAEPVISNSSTFTYQHTAMVGSLRITLCANDLQIQLNVYDTASQQWKVKDSIIYTRITATSTNEFGSVKVVPMATNVALLWTDRTVVGAVLTISTLAVSTPAVVQADQGGFDAVYMANSTNLAKLAIVTTRIRTYSDALVYDATVGELTGFPQNFSKNLYYAGASAPQNLFLLTCQQEIISGGITDFYGAQSLVSNFVTVTTSITNSATTVTETKPRDDGSGRLANAPFFHAAGACLDPRNANTVIWMVSFYYSSLIVGGNAKEYRTYLFRTSITGTVSGAASIYSYSGVMMAQPIVVGSTVLTPMLYESDALSSLVMTDLYRGKITDRAYPVAKYAENLQYVQLPLGNTFLNNKLITQTQLNTSGVLKFYYTGATELINQPNKFQSQGVYEFTLDTVSNQAPTIQANQGLYVGGASPCHFDGSEFGELGFIARPAAPFFAIGQPVTVTVTQQGTASLPEITRFTFSGGNTFPQTGAGLKVQLTFPASSAYFWFNTGSNTDPGGTGASVQVIIGPSWSAQEVLKAFYQASNSVIGDILGGSALATTLTTNSISFTNAANGAVADPAITPPSSGPAGNLSAGTYQVRSVFKYINQRGQIFRSSPSDPVSFAWTGTAQDSVVSVICPFTDITSRDFTLNEVEIYMTSANGNVFYLIATNSQATRKSWVTNDSRVTFSSNNNPTGTIVTFDPLLYTANRTLYTTGAVLENDFPFNWDKVTFHKGRLVVGFPESDQVTYSKTITPEEGVTFSDFLTIQFDRTVGGLTAIASLDDKFIAFTLRDKRVVVGDPANDLGANASFSFPSLISSDTGAVSQAGIVENTDGVYYKSEKGIYRINRSMQDEYIGAAVEDYNSFTVSKGVTNRQFNEIVFVLKDSPFALVYNYYQNLWTTWGNSQMSHVSEGLAFTTTAGRVWLETPTVFKDVDGGSEVAVPLTIEMPWLKAKGQQDYQRVKQFMVLGELKSAHSMQAEVWWDYDKRDLVKQTMTLASSAVVSGTGYADQTYQMQFSPFKQKCESIKIRLTDIPDLSTSGESCTLNAVDFRVGLKQGQSKLKEAKQS